MDETLEELTQISDNIDDPLEISVLDDFDTLTQDMDITVASDSLVTPCIVIPNLEYEVELSYLANRKVDLQKSLPLFIYVDTVCKQIGSFEMTLDAVLELKLIGISQFVLYKSAEDKVSINTNNPEDLEKFISL